MKYVVSGPDITPDAGRLLLDFELDFSVAISVAQEVTCMGNWYMPVHVRVQMHACCTCMCV